MARPLQKKKNKSSLPRVRQKPKSKKLLNIKSNPIVAANWNSKETITQNYRRLGLTSRLKAPTGGVEKHTSLSKPSTSTSTSNTTTTTVPSSSSILLDGPSFPSHSATDSLAIPTITNPKILNPTNVKVTRDPTTGTITSVIRDNRDSGDSDGDGDGVDGDGFAGEGPRERKRRKRNPLNDPLVDIMSSSSSASDMDENRDEHVDEDMTDQATTTTTTTRTKPQRQNPIPSSPKFKSRIPHNHNHNNLTNTPNPNTTSRNKGSGKGIIPALILSSTTASSTKKPPRPQSQREKDWIQQLVDKYGEEDVEGMARDKGLNVRQQSVGDLRRRVAIWRLERNHAEKASA